MQLTALDRDLAQGWISRQGNEQLRQLLVLGATAVVRTVKPGSRNTSAWLLGLLQRRPRKLAARSRWPTRWPVSCGP